MGIEDPKMPPLNGVEHNQVEKKLDPESLSDSEQKEIMNESFLLLEKITGKGKSITPQSLKYHFEGEKGKEINDDMLKNLVSFRDNLHKLGIRPDLARKSSSTGDLGYALTSIELLLEEIDPHGKKDQLTEQEKFTYISLTVNDVLYNVLKKFQKE